MSRPPLSTDEPFDRVFSRPLATFLVAALRRTPITPNQVTVIATVFGLAIGVSLAFGQGLVAALCIFGYLAFDCADGQLARIRGSQGFLGRAVDGVGDYISAISMHVGLAIWLAKIDNAILGPVWAVSAGIAAAWASFLLDRYKRRYRGDTDDVEAIRKEAAETPGWRGRLVASLIPYCERLVGGVTVPDLPAYQERVRFPMRLWLLNGPTMHFFFMAVLFAAERPLLYAWIALGPMTVFSILTLALQQRLEQRAPAVIRTADPRPGGAGSPPPPA
jgi:phosphatidylglycerophosphate synthase